MINDFVDKNNRTKGESHLIIIDIITYSTEHAWVYLYSIPSLKN